MNGSPGYTKLAGRYHWRRDLGSSGGSRRHLGWDPAFRRQVVVEVFARAALQEAGRTRLMERIHVLEELDHPSLVRVLDGGVRDGTPFIACRYHGDDTLEQRLEGGPVPMEDVLRALDEAARALEYVHERGVVHGRLDPAFLVFDRKGRARVWGFAPLPPRLRPADPGYPFQCPEVRLGQEPGVASDVYSLAAIAYCALSGTAPPVEARGRTSARLSAALAASAQSHRRQALAAVFARALDETPSERYARPRDFVRALRSALETPVEPGAPPARELPFRRPWAVAATLAILAAGVAILAMVLIAGDGDPPGRVQPAADGTALAPASPAPSPTSAAPSPASTALSPVPSPSGTAAGPGPPGESSVPTQQVAGTRQPGDGGPNPPLADTACDGERWTAFSVADGGRLFPNETACRFAFSVGACPSPAVVLAPQVLPAPGTAVQVSWQPGCEATGYTLEVTAGDQQSAVVELTAADTSYVLPSPLPAEAAEARIRLTAHYAAAELHWTHERVARAAP
ncbi:MAG: protein kinase [Dehalococcoidia bacterium]|nr:protein kinase [Dehalococcoidia bacterium]